ncbi:MAG: hypothetical protein ACOX3T_06785 [Bdellovibrionota bacterium]
MNIKKLLGEEIKKLNPGTIIVAPENSNLEESLKNFKILEKAS